MVKNKPKKYIDVRSPSEFQKGHIPGAINLPILYDAERHEVGWIYKNASIEEAKRKGLLYGSQKLQTFYETIASLASSNDIVFYCARGGYRSNSVASLFNGIGTPVSVLPGGYKAYRKKVLDYLAQATFPTFIGINGMTGTGKTHVLHALEKAGVPTLDLEGAANHKGSNLGSIGTSLVQSLQQFENQVVDTLQQIKHSYCLVEMESRRIGSIVVPKRLFEAYHSPEAPAILIEATLLYRVSSLMKDYAEAEHFSEEFIKGMKKIKPYLSQNIADQIMDAFHAKELEQVAQLLLTHHYDPLYTKSVAHRTYLKTFHNGGAEQCAEDIIQWLNTTSFVGSL